MPSHSVLVFRFLCSHVTVHASLSRRSSGHNHHKLCHLAAHIQVVWNFSACIRILLYTASTPDQCVCVCVCACVRSCMRACVSGGGGVTPTGYYKWQSRLPGSTFYTEGLNIHCLHLHYAVNAVAAMKTAPRSSHMNNFSNARDAC